MKEEMRERVLDALQRLAVETGATHREIITETLATVIAEIAMARGTEATVAFLKDYADRIDSHFGRDRAAEALAAAPPAGTA